MYISNPRPEDLVFALILADKDTRTVVSGFSDRLPGRCRGLPTHHRQRRSGLPCTRDRFRHRLGAYCQVLRMEEVHPVAELRPLPPLLHTCDGIWAVLAGLRKSYYQPITLPILRHSQLYVQVLINSEQTEQGMFSVKPFASRHTRLLQHQ
jgi:hypothetical protein